MRISNKTALAATVALVAATPSVSQAQVGSFLEEVIVTAQKREQNVQDVPISVTAMDNDMLRAAGVDDPTDLSAIVPNMQVGTLTGDTNITIRGVGKTVVGASPGVAIHIDGVYQPRASMADLFQVDMAGVEVLRGPQGTLYGRNANGGAVNFTTESAGNEFGGFISATVAEYEERRLQGAIDIPVSDNVRARLTADVWERGEGFIENVATVRGTNQIVVTPPPAEGAPAGFSEVIEPGSGPDLEEGDSALIRLKVDADLSDTVSANFSATYAQREGSFQYFLAADAPRNYDATRLAFFPQQGVFVPNPNGVASAPGVDAVNSAGHWETVQNGPALQDREYTSLATTVNWDINDTFSLKSITAYQEYEDFQSSDNDLSPVTIVDFFSENNSETLTQEFNLTFDTSTATGVIGFFYMDDSLEGGNNLPFPVGGSTISTGPVGSTPFLVGPQSAVVANWIPSDTETTALFADVTFALTENLSAIVGLRYSEDEYSITQRGGVEILTPTGPDTVGRCDGSVNSGDLADFSPITTEESFNELTPRLGLTYLINEDSNVFATYSEGFKTGGLSYRAGCQLSYDPETVKSFELGSKNTFADGKLRVNVSAFYYDYTGYQVEQLSGLAFILTNADEAEVMGIEFETITSVTDNFSIIANGSFQQSEFVEYFQTDSANIAAGEQDLSGNPLPNSPDTTLNLSFVYQMDNGLSFQLGAAYKSEINFREFDAAEDAQEAYTVWNGSVRWMDEAGRYDVRLYANNITEEEYFQKLIHSSLSDSRQGSVGAPRQIGLEFGYNF